MNNIKGKVFVLGDNVDTDQIIPAEHLVYKLDDEEESKLYGKFALSSVPPEKSGLPGGFIPYVEDEQFESEYSIIVAGGNFGCGSSREHAPFALMKAGCRAVIAESYARIFYRNSVDGGFLIPFQSRDNIVSEFNTGDIVELNVDDCKLINITRGKTYNLKPLGEALPIVSAGGLFEYARQNSMI